MEDLAKADIKTIRTFIDNNITAERLLVDVLHPKKDAKQEKGKQAKQSTHSGEKPRKQVTKKISGIVQTGGEEQICHQEEPIINSEERARQRKKHKNQRKKRKRYERKAIQEHKDDIQLLWSGKLQELLRERNTSREGRCSK
jgi:hypothetical protein